MGLTGWLSITFGVINVVLSFFMEVDSPISLRNIIVILGAVALSTFSGVSVVLKIIRSSLFRPKKNRSLEYVKAGLFGAAAFGIIILLAWIVPDFGPVIQLEWWGYVLIGLVLLTGNKLMERLKLY